MVLPDSPIYSFEVCCPCPWGHEEGFNGIGTLEMYLDPQVVACPFEPCSQSKDVRYHYGDVLLVVICYTVVAFVVRLIVSGSLSIVDVVFVVKFVL